MCAFYISDGDYVSQLLYVWYYVGVMSSFQHARVECVSKRVYVFVIPCELLFLLCCIASWTRGVVSVMLYPCILCCSVNGSVCLACLTVFVNCFDETIRKMFGCGYYFVVEWYGSV